MNEHQTLIVLSAFAGLAGAVLTQLLTGMFSYVNDRRKLRHELYQNFCNRKAEIGENFYFMTGERMTLINNTIRYWKNWNDSRSESSLAYLKKEMNELLQKMEELNAENWKYNLAGLYFKISFTYREVIAANAISHRHYLKVLDIGDRLNRATEENRELLYQAYAKAIFDMCTHYETVYARMEQDMSQVKAQLEKGFALN
jgi:hypothetical protein